jgi:hypothetical protein
MIPTCSVRETTSFFMSSRASPEDPFAADPGGVSCCAMFFLNVAFSCASCNQTGRDIRLGPADGRQAGLSMCFHLSLAILELMLEALLRFS